MFIVFQQEFHLTLNLILMYFQKVRVSKWTVTTGVIPNWLARFQGQRTFNQAARARLECLWMSLSLEVCWRHQHLNLFNYLFEEHPSSTSKMGRENMLPVHWPCPSSWYWKCQETSYSFPVENYTALLTFEHPAAEKMLWSAFLHHLRIVRVRWGVRLTPTAFSLTYVDELNYQKKKPKGKPQKNP